MRQKERNKLFRYFKKEHLILLTEDEIDEIEDLVKGPGEKEAATRIIEERIAFYRTINVVVFSIINILVPFTGVHVAVWLFVSFNVIMVIYYLYKLYSNGYFLQK